MWRNGPGGVSMAQQQCNTSRTIDANSGNNRKRISRFSNQERPFPTNMENYLAGVKHGLVLWYSELIAMWKPLKLEPLDG